MCRSEGVRVNQSGKDPVFNCSTDISWRAHKEWLKEILDIMDTPEQRCYILERYFETKLRPSAPKN